jgi:hypothetical protein
MDANGEPKTTFEQFPIENSQYVLTFESNHRENLNSPIFQPPELNVFSSISLQTTRYQSFKIQLVASEFAKTHVFVQRNILDILALIGGFAFLLYSFLRQLVPSDFQLLEFMMR